MSELFTAHTSARLTFIIGIVIGISIMTVGGMGFFAFVFSGGNVGTYAIAPLDTGSKILNEPVKSIANGEVLPIAEPPDYEVYGATTDYKVTLVDYTDYECPFCKKFFPEVLQFVDEHSATVRLIVKQYPLVQIHPNAKTAATAAVCAGQQGQLVNYSTALYANQSSLADPALYTNLADTLKLDATLLATCRTAEDTTSIIETNAAEALGLAVKSQPNLVIQYSDGTLDLIDGYVNKSYLEELLAKEIE